MSIIIILALARQNYSYYEFLRWSVFIGSIILIAILISFKLKYENKIVIYSFLIILFNPLFPIYLSRTLWSIIDIILGLILLYFSFNHFKSINLKIK